MKTEISRESHDPLKNYSGVYQQQGRMITDADGNEATEIGKLRVDDALHDVIGGGSPRDRGVHIGPDAAAGAAIRIEGTHLYADGLRGIVRGEVDGTGIPLDKQTDFPKPPPLPSGVPYCLYGDLWERTVTHLENPGLLDAGLHGADTCTRTQTMAQIKWGPDTMNFEPETGIPGIGNAKLTVELASASEAKDGCDPCAEVIDVKPRVGNYAFRLEVHNVKGAPADPDELTLKWSGENGAEQHRVDKAPPAFQATGPVWEFFSDASERHLGYHHPDNVSDSFPCRGVLSAAWLTTLVQADYPFVRRWDGYIVLKRGANGKLAATNDACGVLSAEISGSNLVVTTERVKLTLQLDGATFLAGDYWLAPVREDAVDADGKPQPVSFSNEPPIGVRHHYVRLASVSDQGVLIDLLPKEKRRLCFPPLTDIQADDVGYQKTCDSSSLFDGKQLTVKDALDRLCDLSASQVKHIPCTRSDAATPLIQPGDLTVQAALSRLCELAAQHVAYAPACNPPAGVTPLFTTERTVKNALDRVCGLSAEHVSYKPGCDLLMDTKTVQEALDKLCKEGHGECCHTVIAQDGDLADLLIELLKSKQHVCVCLLPGQHKLPHGFKFDSDKHTLCIHGCGHASTSIELGAPMLLSRLPSFELDGVELLSKSAEAVVAVVAGQRIRFSSCRLQGGADKIPILTIAATESIDLSDNVIEGASSEAVAVVVNDAQAHTTLARNVLKGAVSFYGLQLNLTLASDRFKVIDSNAAQGAWRVTSTGRDLRVSDNRLARWTIGDSMLHILGGNPQEINKVFQNAIATNNVLDSSQPAFLLAFGVNLSSTRLDGKIAAGQPVGLVVANNAIYVGTHANGGTLYSATPATKTKAVASLDVDIPE